MVQLNVGDIVTKDYPNWKGIEYHSQQSQRFILSYSNKLIQGHLQLDLYKLTFPVRSEL